MSIRISILGILLLVGMSMSAQKIYSVDHEYQADIKVFVVDSEYKADLIVYKTDKEYRAKASENKGIWFICPRQYQADKKCSLLTESIRLTSKYSLPIKNIVLVGRRMTRNL